MEISGYRWGCLAEICGELEALDSVRAPNESKITTLFENILKNRTLYEHADSGETLRFIKCLYKSMVDSVNPLCLEILGIAVHAIVEDLPAIRELKEVDFILYQKALGQFISMNDDRSTYDLGITQDELFDAAAYITKLYLDGNQEAFSDEFLTTIFTKMEQITRLTIENSDITGDSFTALKKENLKSLRLSECGAFNGSLKDFPNLKNLELILLEDYEFNVQNAPKLKHLRVHCVYGEMSINQFSELKTLCLTVCPDMNEPIEGFQKLKYLCVDSAGYNSKISNLPLLVDLEFVDCRVFNSDLENLPKLQRFSMKATDEEVVLEFKIFERSMETILLIAQTNMKFVDQEMLKFTNAEKQQGYQKCLAYLEFIIQNYKAIPDHKVATFFRVFLRFVVLKDISKLPPLYRMLYVALAHEHMLERNVSANYVLESILTKSKHKDFNVLFTPMLHHCPKVVAFLLENAPDQFWAWMKEYSISLFDLPLVVQGIILPYTSPEQIRETFSKLTEDQKTELLQFHLEFLNVSDSMNPVLSQVKRYNIDTVSHERRRLNTQVLGEFLSKIPLINLACYAHFHPKILSAFCYAMTIGQLTVVVPLLESAVFLEMLKKMPVSNHKTYLTLAAIDQRAEYVAKDLCVIPSIQETVSRAKLLRDVHLENPSEKSRDELKQFVTCTLFPVKTSLSQFDTVLKAMKPILSHGYIESKELELSQIQNELISCYNELEQELSKNDVVIPESYFDALTNAIMTDPLTDGTFTMDRATWQRCFMMDGKHPFTRLPLILANLKESDLKNELIEFHKKASLG